MSFWRSLPGALVIIVVLALGAMAGAVGVQVWGVLHPDRIMNAAIPLATELARVEEVTFPSTDGVPLSGWLLSAGDRSPAVILGHDLAESKASLVNLGIALHKAGFTVLAFDFRGHGRSGGDSSTLGIVEARDVLGCVDYLVGKRHVDDGRIGVYGTGMGAYAAVLAAADRPSLKVLVLDGVYPDVTYPLVRRAFLRWPFGVRHLGPLARLAYAVLSGEKPSSHRAADVLPTLRGREILLVAPAGDGALTSEMQRMYDDLPSRRDGEANLLTLPATRASGLTGAELVRFQDRVVAFLEPRLARR